MKIGNYNVSVHNMGNFALDGGSMFGSVPKNLWNRKLPADEQNRIPLATNSVLLEGENKKILVDVGNGSKWPDKLKEIYAIETFPESDLAFKFAEITDVILTHLHFDHAGGISYYDVNQELQLSFPNAKIHLQKSNLENAKNPTIKERASYFKENWGPIEQAELNLLDGNTEILPGIFSHLINGHTRGQQWIRIKGETETLVIPSDLMPTSHHVPVAFHMGYDICAGTLLEEKSNFLKQATENNWIVLFQHDRDKVAGRISLNEKRQFAISECVDL
ncbi:MAG: MBL fold metallo-hydrolase [Bdellovibrionota bacterium]